MDWPLLAVIIKRVNGFACPCCDNLKENKDWPVFVVILIKENEDWPVPAVITKREKMDCPCCNN